MILKGKLTALGPAITRIDTRGLHDNHRLYAHLEIGTTRTRKISINLDIDDQLEACLGRNVEISIHKSLRWGLHRRHIMAVKTDDGRVYKSGYILDHIRLTLYYMATSIALIGIPVYWWYSSRWYGDDVTALGYATLASLPIIIWGGWRYLKTRNAFGKENLGGGLKRL